MENYETTTKSSSGPKDFFLNLGVFVGLYVSAISLLNLLFKIIDTAFPDKLESYIDPYSTGLRWAVALLVIFFPTYLFLVWTINKDINLNPGKKNIWIKRWLSYLTLFVAGLTIAIDLVTLINSFLGGEITARFVLKVTVVLIVAVGVFGYYLYELKRLPGGKDKTLKMFAWAPSVVVLASLVGGFLVMGSPATAREIRFDLTRVNDLNNIQWQVVDYWQRLGKLPNTTADLKDNLSGFVAPTDPETGIQYDYQTTGKLSFGLCATFGRKITNTGANAPYLPASLNTSDSWNHEAGHQCFDRTIDPSKYPPRSSQSVPSTVVTPKGL